MDYDKCFDCEIEFFHLKKYLSSSSVELQINEDDKSRKFLKLFHTSKVNLGKVLLHLCFGKKITEEAIESYKLQSLNLDDAKSPKINESDLSQPEPAFSPFENTVEMNYENKYSSISEPFINSEGSKNDLTLPPKAFRGYSLEKRFRINDIKAKYNLNYLNIENYTPKVEPNLKVKISVKL